MSVWVEFGPLLEELLGQSIQVNYGDWRTGDQPVYINDISKAKRELGWFPNNTVHQGITKLFVWVREHTELFNYL